MDIYKCPKSKPRSETISKEKKETNNWNCDACGTICQTEKQFLIHQESNKHKRNLNAKNETHFTPKNPNTICDICNIEFNSRTTLWRHKKKCNNKESIDMAYMTEKIDASLVMELIKQNKELQQQLVFNNNQLNSFYAS